MNQEIQKALNELRKALVDNVSSEVVSVNIFINCEGETMEIKTASAESLRSRFVSMRNVAGEFIK